MAKCSNCGREYRADLMAVCPGCSSPAAISATAVTQTTASAMQTVLHTRPRKSSGFGVTLVIFLIVGAVGWGLWSGGYLDIKMLNTGVSNQSSGGGLVTVEEAPAKIEEEPVPTGHYETECRWVSSYNVQFDGTIEKVKERECVDKWVED
jgi:hypothetical protein